MSHVGSCASLIETSLYATPRCAGDVVRFVLARGFCGLCGRGYMAVDRERLKRFAELLETGRVA